MRTAPDEELIRASRKGDAAAFSVLVGRYQDTVYRFSFKICRDREKAEETLQDTFINVYRKLNTFDGRSKFSTWLYRIVTNNCLMKLRKRKLHATVESLEDMDDPPDHEGAKHTDQIGRWDETPADELLSKELRALIEKAIAKLPMDYRVVFVLRDIEGKSTEETARILSLSIEATKSRLRRARAFLRAQLNPYMTS